MYSVSAPLPNLSYRVTATANTTSTNTTTTEKANAQIHSCPNKYGFEQDGTTGDIITQKGLKDENTVRDYTQNVNTFDKFCEHLGGYESNTI